MGWSEDHVHTWTVHTRVTMMVEAEVAGDEDLVAEIPFCPWICACGAWCWKISPEAMCTDGTMEI